MKIVLKNIQFNYGDRTAINDVSYAFDEGLVTGLIGPNGSGKTTLIRLIAGLLKPDSGQVLMDDKPGTSMPEKKRAQLLALVPQYARLDFDFTVLDMVLMGRQPYIGRFDRERPEDIRYARTALERLGLSSFENRNARLLSGGESQRVLVARALCQNTPAMLMDEPVASLDIRHQMETLSIVRQLSCEQGVSVIMVLHDLNLAAHYCDRLVLMKEGKLEASGTSVQVLTREKLLSVYGIEAAIEAGNDDTVTIKPHYM